MPGMRKTMKEFGAWMLHSGSKRGPIVKKRSQAIAIGMSEGRRDASRTVKPSQAQMRPRKV